MIVLVWITENTWQSAIDAARRFVAAGATFTILYGAGDEIAAAAHGAFAGLMGRGRPARDPGIRVERLAEAQIADLLNKASERLGAPVTTLTVHGKIEQEVVHAAEKADLLICARDGDRTRPGPHSISPATRFVVDHASAAVLLVW